MKISNLKEISKYKLNFYTKVYFDIIIIILHILQLVKISICIYVKYFN